MNSGAIMCDVRQGPWALKMPDHTRSRTIRTAPAAKPETAAAAQSVARHCELRKPRRASMVTSLARMSAARDGKPCPKPGAAVTICAGCPGLRRGRAAILVHPLPQQCKVRCGDGAAPQVRVRLRVCVREARGDQR